MSEDLLDVTTHFRFGENWADYSDLVDERRIASARDNVAALAGDLRGKSFLDIGSGSGLFSVAALRLGASRVLAVDIDPRHNPHRRGVVGRIVFSDAPTWEGRASDVHAGCVSAGARKATRQRGASV